MSTKMHSLKIIPFIKCIVLEINPFGSKIIDERNFSYEEKEEMDNFEKNYLDRNDYIIIKIAM